MALDSGKIRDFVQTTWDASIIPTLTDYIKIPAKSPMFDAQWREHGHIDRAVELLRGWAGSRPIEGLRIEVVRLEGRTPLLFMEAPGTRVDTVLLYGHLDKQPEMVGWAEGTGPWTPLRRGDKLYGRGVGGALTVEVLTEGVHSGAASGIVPSSFRIVRQILDRLEDARTGEVLPRDFHVEIPRERLAEAREVASVLGAEIYDRFPFLPG